MDCVRQSVVRMVSETLIRYRDNSIQLPSFGLLLKYRPFIVVPFTSPARICYSIADRVHLSLNSFSDAYLV